MATFSDFGKYEPVFDPADSKLYFNKTGIFTTTSPSNDTGTTGNWELLASSSSGGHVTDIVKNATTGEITVTFADGSTAVMFASGHTLQNEANAILDYRQNLQIKGDTLFEIKDADTVELDLEQIDTNESDISTNTGAISTNTGNISTNTGNISTNTGNISTNTGNISTNAGKISTNETDITNIEAKTDLIEIATNTVNLNTLSDEVAAILLALEHSDTGAVSQAFNIPANDRYWKTADFSTRTDVGISSAGVITRSTNWVYDVRAEIYTPPIIAYHSQTATVNATNFTYITLGFVFSKARHSAYIDIFKKLDKDNYIPDMNDPNYDASIPNPNSIYLENDSGARFTPYSAMSQASTDGVTIFKQTDPSAFTELYTMTVAIEAQFVEHYDDEQRFTIQVDDRGIRGFHVHTGDDTLNTAKIKAAIKANTEAINVEREILNHYPQSTEIVTAINGQVLTKELVETSGSKASGSFEIANVQSAGGTDSALLVITYPDSSPLDDFPRITIPITIAAGDNPSDVANKIVVSFGSSIDATLSKFRDGYTKGGFAYGGYSMSNDLAVITLVSDDDGSVYNAALSVYEGVGRFGVINANPIAHGTGGPEPKVIFTTVSFGATPIDSSGSGTNGYATAKARGFSVGQQIVFNQAEGAGTVDILETDATPSTMVFTFKAVADFGLGLTSFSGLGSFIETVTAPNPAVGSFLIGNYSTDAANQGLIQVSSQTNEFLLLPSRVTDTAEGWAASASSLINDEMTTDAAGTEYAARAGDSPIFTTRPKYRRLFNSTLNGAVMTWTTVATGAAQTAPTWSDAGTDVVDVVSTNGVDGVGILFNRGAVITCLSINPNVWSSGGISPTIYTGGDF